MLQMKFARPSNFVPKVILAGGDLVRYGLPQCELGYQFFNGTSADVTVITRTGVQIEIPPIKGVKFHSFVIRTCYSSKYGVNVDTRGLLNDEGPTTSLEAEKLESALFRDDMRPGRSLSQSASVDYVITRQEFDANGGNLYLPNLDLTLSVLNRHYAPRHPYSRTGIRQALIDNDPILGSEEGLSYQIRIVDRHGRFGDRFINLGGDVFHIKTTTLSDAIDGVYLTSATPANGAHEANVPRSDYFKFEDADKVLKMYNTYNEAKTLGNPGDVYKRELEDRAHQLKLDEHRLKNERQLRDVEWEDKKRQLEIERETAKAEQQRREDDLRTREYELSRMEQDFKLRDNQNKRDMLLLKEVSDQRSHDRKETLEILKHIPTLISGIGAIYLAVKKLKG